MLAEIGQSFTENGMSALNELRIDLMKLDYADRQMVVVRPDDVVFRARHEARQPPAPVGPGTAKSGKSEGAIAALSAPIGEAIRTVASRWSQWRTERRNVPVLPLTRSEARLLHFPVGHPRDEVVYVGNPAVPSVYFTLADFHRQTFAHKFSEAMELVSALGARSMSVAARQGWSREFASSLKLPALERAVSGGGQTSTSRELLYTAELEGSGDPRLPQDLQWYFHESEWQAVARQRIEHDLREFTLHVRYEDDFAVTADVAAELSAMGLQAGGTFQRHQSTIWSIAATFPPNQSRVLRAIKHPFG
jgi:hypothetical protein